MNATGSPDASGYERWPHSDSYAYLSVCDGPDDDHNVPAPTLPPPLGDPQLYSFDPAVFTGIVSILPTKTARRGEQVQISPRITPRYYAFNIWELRSALPRDAAPHEHVKNVLLQLSSNWRRFVEASRPYIVIMHVVSKGVNPGLVLDRHTIERLTQVRASLDVDMYPEGPSEYDG